MRRRGAFILALLILASSSLARPTFAQPDWRAFWRQFRAAVVNSDKKTVLALSTSADVPDGYRELFGTRARRRCFARAKPVKDEQGGYSVFCGEQGYYFGLVNGQYKFTDPFAND